MVGTQLMVQYITITQQQQQVAGYFQGKRP
jgi:hypothetical protein